MDNLFSEIQHDALAKVAPLAVRMRPRTLEELVGQQTAIGEGTWFRGAIEADKLTSAILFGPAGTGKTTIAKIIAQMTNAHFTEVSAITGGVSDLRRVINEASERLVQSGMRTILFVDEIHRFSRSQQDALLHAVEDNIVTLIGATTENPYFEVNTALLSRSRIVELQALDDEAIKQILTAALVNERGLGSKFTLDDDALTQIVLKAGGDARTALTTLEMAAQLAREGRIGVEQVTEAAPHSNQPYDKAGDTHYDVISAFIKSMRGSSPDGAIYWLARMLEGGEDPKFIARRIYIFASEDIGNADPQALLVADAAFRAVEVIGLPECQLNLAQAALYMALAPKSNSATNAIYDARTAVSKGALKDVPSHLRDRHRPGSDGYGKYLYPHNDPRGYADQQYLPDGIEPGEFYKPSERGWESYRTKAPTTDR